VGELIYQKPMQQQPYRQKRRKHHFPNRESCCLSVRQLLIVASIEIEVADDDLKRARGSMYRKSISENGGMHFSHVKES
jgi:hypothetical protein